MGLSIYAECETEFLKDYTGIAQKVADTVLSHYSCPFDVQLSLYIVGEEEIREANRQCRGIDRVTDVLSFPNLPFTPDHVAAFDTVPEGDADLFDPESGELVLGEIMICAEKARAQAEEYGHGIVREFAFLVAHSMLHLLGYDHEEEEERKEMERLQEELLKEAGYERC